MVDDAGTNWDKADDALEYGGDGEQERHTKCHHERTRGRESHI